MKIKLLILVTTMLAFSACQEEVSVGTPDPAILTQEAIGHYCQMIVLNHEGPKAQIHLSKKQDPIWFTQVRDAIAFTKLPEETEEVTAIYVNDMGAAANWKNPGNDNWIDATTAFYVLDSKKTGGMGAPEAVPFATSSAAEEFAKLNGGDVVAFAQIPSDYILGPVDVDLSKHDMHSHKQETSQ